MRVIFVNRFFFPDHSATSQMLTDLDAALGQSHMDVAVITSRQRIDDPGAGLPARDRVAGADVHRVWSSTFGRRSLVGRALDYLTFYLGAGWRLMGLCVRDDVVVAKTDPPLISVVAGLVVRLRGARQVNWLQDLFPEIAEVLGVGGVSGWRARVLARWRDASLRLAHTNVVLGERMAARVKARGIDDTRIRVITTGATVSSSTRCPAPITRCAGSGGSPNASSPHTRGTWATPTISTLCSMPSRPCATGTTSASSSSVAECAGSGWRARWRVAGSATSFFGPISPRKG
jgi:hypothetical protein